MKVKVNVEEEYTVDVNPLEIFTTYMNKGYTFHVSANFIEGESKSAHLIMTNDGVKVNNTIRYGFSGGHYECDDTTEIIDVPEDFPEETVELFKAYHTIRAHMIKDKNL